MESYLGPGWKKNSKRKTLSPLGTSGTSGTFDTAWNATKLSFWLVDFPAWSATTPLLLLEPNRLSYVPSTLTSLLAHPRSEVTFSYHICCFHEIDKKNTKEPLPQRSLTRLINTSIPEHKVSHRNGALFKVLNNQHYRDARKNEGLWFCKNNQRTNTTFSRPEKYIL